MKMTKRILATATAALTVTAALAGCTGGTSSDNFEKLLPHRQMQTKYIISVFVSLFSMRLLTPQLRALKTLLLKNSAQTRLSLTSRTHRAMQANLRYHLQPVLLLQQL